MAVFRINKTNGYSVMSNTHFRDRRMSLKAKGLLSLMLSLPDDWDYTEEGLTQLSCDGLASVRAGLKELEQFGFLRRAKITNARGQFQGMEYNIYENPFGWENNEPYVDDNRNNKKPFSENPITEKPITEKPIAENRIQLNTNISNTKEYITNELSTNKRFTRPSVEDVAEYCREHSLNVDAKRFVDYYNSNGWRVGRNPMKDWKATCRNWSRTDEKPKGKLKSKPTYDINDIQARSESGADIEKLLEELG